VFVVQPWCRIGRDEKLRTIGAWACVGHADCIRSACIVKWEQNKIERSIAHLSCFKSSENSSSNSLPQIDVPPVPSPRGSPV
jgi:hypothetical protein